MQLELAADLTRHARAVNVVRWSPCGDYLATGDDDAYIIIWRLKSDSEPINICGNFPVECWIDLLSFPPNNAHMFLVCVVVVWQTKRRNWTKRPGWCTKRWGVMWTTYTICHGHRTQCSCYPDRLTTRPSYGMSQKARVKDICVITKVLCKALRGTRKINTCSHCPPIDISVYTTEIHWKQFVE